MSDYTELKRLAEAATQCSGHRRVEIDYNGVHQVVGDGGWKILGAWHTPDGRGLDNAKFTAAASPTAVLALIAENERLERNRDMWKDQVERQAEELVSFRSELRVMDVLAEAMAEVKATSDGESAQPIVDIVSGCLSEIAALSHGEQSEIHHTSWALVHEPPPTCVQCGVKMFTGIAPQTLCNRCKP